MRLIEIITGEEAKLESQLQHMLEECGDYLEEVGFNARRVFHGTHRELANLVTAIPVTNRRPKDTPGAVHEYIDEYFVKKFDANFRSHAIFASGNSASAMAYGKLHIVVPVNGYRYCWSKRVEDLYSDLGQWADKSKALSKLFDFKTRTLDDQMEAELDEFLSDSQYQTTDIVAAIDSGYEIMFECDHCYLIKFPNGLHACRATKTGAEIFG